MDPNFLDPQFFWDPNFDPNFWTPNLFLDSMNLTKLNCRPIEYFYLDQNVKLLLGSQVWPWPYFFYSCIIAYYILACSPSCIIASLHTWKLTYFQPSICLLHISIHSHLHTCILEYLPTYKFV